MFRVKKVFKACENGVDVVEYPPGVYESLPNTARKFAEKSGLMEEVGAEGPTENDVLITLGEGGVPVVVEGDEPKATGPNKNKASKGAQKTK